MSREELINKLKYTMEKHEHDVVHTFGTNISLMCKDVLDYLEQEQKTGKWIIDNEYMDRRKMYHYSVHCSNCGFRGDYSTDEEGSVMSNFCPNCGARMIESQESEG